MQSTESKLTRYQLKKQAVFDALYKCCERNKHEQVSLKSILQYISKEIGSNFKNSECIVNELTEKLKNKSQNGWLSFIEVCDILSCWMDNICCTSQCDAQKKNSNVLECTSQNLKCQPALSLSSWAVRKTAINGDVVENLVYEELFTKCEKCSRDGNCCEWRNSDVSREECITQCYEQKVIELQNLLRQSEDYNSVIQLENESLRQNNVILQNKEQRWMTKEEELTEHEQQLLSANLFLREQNDIVEKAIENLKQQLSYVKNENENLVSENLLLKERVADISRIEKLLFEARLQHSQMQIDLNAKDTFLGEFEAKLDQLQLHNEVLEIKISEMQKRNLPVSSVERLHEQSLGEELLMADINAKCSFKSIDLASLDIPEKSSLKAELDACGEWPLLCEHIAVQATPDVSTSSTQTTSSKTHKLNEGSISFHHNQVAEDQKLVVTDHSEKMSSLSETESTFCEESEYFKQHLGSSVKSMQTLGSIPFISEKDFWLYAPFVEETALVKMTRQYQSMYQMEVFLMADALTQTEPSIKRRNIKEFIVNVSLASKLLTEKQVDTDIRTSVRH